jgi:mannose/fructose/N-acetylgalactosamine-specific phosphotransferase system component IIB
VELVLVRIDNRLIHGQVSTMWVGNHKIDHLIVANDAAAKNPVEKSVLKMAKPRTIKALDVLTVAEAAKLILSDKSKSRAMVVGRVPQDIRGLLDAGIAIKELYVGNMHGGPGKEQLDQCVAVDPEEKATLKGFVQEGITLISQMTPSSPRSELNSKL